jgi:hypothetical protein
MKRNGLVSIALVLGFALGNVVPGLVGAAPKVGDLKFENQFIKTFAPTADKPITVRVTGGAEYQVQGISSVEDDFVVLALNSGSANIRTRDNV